MHKDLSDCLIAHENPETQINPHCTSKNNYVGYTQDYKKTKNNIKENAMKINKCSQQSYLLQRWMLKNTCTKPSKT